jgi:hypothetical protein
MQDRSPRRGPGPQGVKIVSHLITTRVAGSLIGAGIAFAAVASGASAGHDGERLMGGGGFAWVSAAIGASGGAGVLVALLAIVDMSTRPRSRRASRRRHRTVGRRALGASVAQRSDRTNRRVESPVS